MTAERRARTGAAILAALVLTACATVESAVEETGDALVSGVAAVTGADDGGATMSGSFLGKGDHDASGDVRVVRTDGGYVVMLDDGFRFDGAPRAKLGFGKNGRYDADAQFADLEANNGAQTYVLPAGIDPTAYNQLWLWSEQLGEPVGVAPIG